MSTCSTRAEVSLRRTTRGAGREAHRECERQLEESDGVVRREGRRVRGLLREHERHLVDRDRVDHVELHGGLKRTG